MLRPSRLRPHGQARHVASDEAIWRVQDTPEMFPATVDEWAEPLEGDDAEVAVIRPLLAGTRLREARLRRASSHQCNPNSKCPGFSWMT